jgi:hypothetical protein
MTGQWDEFSPNIKRDCRLESLIFIFCMGVLSIQLREFPYGIFLWNEVEDSGWCKSSPSRYFSNRNQSLIPAFPVTQNPKENLHRCSSSAEIRLIRVSFS